MAGIEDLGKLLSSIYSKQNRQQRTSDRKVHTGKTLLDQVSFRITYSFADVLTDPLWAGPASGFSTASNTYYSDGEFFK